MSLDRPAVGWAIGQAVRKARKAAGLKQTDVARRVGIDLQYLSMIELGKRATSIAVVFAIAKALGITPGVLVTRAQRLVAKYPRPRVNWWHEHKEARSCRHGGR